MKPKLNAVYLTALDMKRAVRFYEDLFETTVTEFDERMSTFRLGELDLLLYNPAADGVEPMFGDNVVINVEVADVDAMLRRLTEIGCAVIVPITRVGPDLFFQATDLEGNTVEFYQTVPE